MTSFAVEVTDLSVKFADFYAVNNISFNVTAGEIFGFLGANGAGKTTTIRVLCGLLLPSAGKVIVASHDVRDSEQFIKAKVGYMSQKFTLYNDLTVAENLNFIAALRKIKNNIYMKRRTQLFDFIEFKKSINSKIADLSAGIKQQVSLAAALLHDPDIIFLDEPTAGVSPASRTKFWDLIRQLAANGKTVFVTTHYMDEAEQCGKIALMRDGKIVALDTPAMLKDKTFPLPMFEFDPKRKLRFEEILELSQDPVFSFFEAYGLRFHASVANLNAWLERRHIYEQNFNITKIRPSLEDVFIRTVEVAKA